MNSYGSLASSEDGYSTGSCSTLPDTSKHTERSIQYSQYVRIVVIVLLITFVLVSNYANPFSSSTRFLTFSSNNNQITTVPPVVVVEPIDFEFHRNGYDSIDLDDEYRKYFILAEYDAIIEPYVEMVLDIDDYNENTTYYRYDLCPYGSSDPFDCENGVLSPSGFPENTTSVTVECEPYDVYSLTVSEFIFDESDETGVGVLSRVTNTKAICIYVRREIRSYATDDLDAILDAMYVLWNVTQSEGKDLYGDDFNTAYQVSAFHHFNSAWQDADHIHEGNGFILQHIKMTNMFEKAMQSVDPSVALPYWDFTIESANGTALFDSPVFTAEVFGSMPNCSDYWWGFQYGVDDVEDAAIPDGRWAFIEADWNTEYEDLLFGYGYMRAPWSMNPSKYVSRFTSDWQIGTTLPRCSSHYNMLAYTDLMDFLMDAGDDPHSSAHSLIGGMYGCDLFLPLLRLGYINDHDALMTICGKWAFVMKELYRNDLLAPMTNCSVSELDCGFECDDADSGDMMFLVEELISSSVPESMNERGWTAWTDFICDGDGWKIVPGDHLESASPTDPSFWSIHPTLERLLQVKFMSGGFENNTWHTNAETQNICHHASCYEESKNETGFFQECCYGHYENDQMFNAFTGDRLDFYGPTNEAMLTATNPTSLEYAMPYIYDSFTWDHCADIDIDFEDLLYDFYKSYVLGIDDDDASGDDYQVYNNSHSNNTYANNTLNDDYAFYNASSNSSMVNITWTDDINAAYNASSNSTMFNITITDDNSYGGYNNHTNITTIEEYYYYNSNSTTNITSFLMPSESPTLSPVASLSPTPSLSSTPTEVPTLSPTFEPTLEPTFEPTLAPTTLEPTLAPDGSTTYKPTHKPTSTW